MLITHLRFSVMIIIALIIPSVIDVALSVLIKMGII